MPAAIAVVLAEALFIGTAAILASRSFWLGLLVALVFIGLLVVPIWLAIRASREISAEQRVRWGLAPQMNEEEHRLARRLGGVYIISRVVFYGTLVTAAAAIEGREAQAAMVATGFVLSVVSYLLVRRVARERLPQLANPWTKHRTR